jgi:hypothetical protein
MIHRSIGLALAVVLALPVMLLAQTAAAKHPDFTGSWKVTNIEMPEAPAGDFGGGNGGGGRGFGGRRGGFGGGRRGAANGDPDAANGGGDRPQRLEAGDVVHIKQTDERLIVTQDTPGGSVMNSYGLDGKTSTNRAGQGTMKSTTRWDGVALVTDITRSMETQRGNFNMKSREVRSLDQDGRTMTVRTTLESPRGKQTMTVTYVKVDD